MSRFAPFQPSTELLAYYRWVSQQPLTIVDIESTGYRPHSHRMIEVAVLQASLVDGIQHQQSDLINPGITIPERIASFTGIDQQMVDAAPSPAVVLPQYWSRLNQGVLTAHHIESDYGFLQMEYRRLDQEFVRPEAEKFCTVRLSRLMLADLPSRSLPQLVQHFQFPIDESHRAAADTVACWYLAKQLLHEIQQEDDETLLQRFAQEWLPIQVVAKLFARSRLKTQKLLESVGIATRSSQQRKAPMYRRGDIERFYAQWQADQSADPAVELS
jgi:DNA polymerase-3 subunit epsilon